jgi:hypothetical protein
MVEFLIQKRANIHVYDGYTLYISSDKGANIHAGEYIYIYIWISKR